MKDNGFTSCDTEGISASEGTQQNKHIYSNTMHRRETGAKEFHHGNIRTV